MALDDFGNHKWEDLFTRQLRAEMCREGYPVQHLTDHDLQHQINENRNYSSMTWLNAPAGSFQQYSETAGSLMVGTGSASLLRIPIPNSENLFLELKPRGFVPGNKSTSTIFIQNLSGKKHMRLDMGYNKVTGNYDYHWNQQGTFDKFGIQSHTPTGKGASLLYHGAKVYRVAGKIFVVGGIGADLYSVVTAKNRTRQMAQVGASWVGAALGCKGLGAVGASLGTMAPVMGTIIGGACGCMVGAVAGGFGFSYLGGEAYDYIDEIFYEEIHGKPYKPGSIP